MLFIQKEMISLKEWLSMKLANLFMILFFFLSCQKKEIRSYIIEVSQKAQVSPLKRALAQADDEACLESFYSVEGLKKEIAFFEERAPKQHDFKGRWGHLNLEELPFYTAKFLSKYGDNLGDLRTKDLSLYKDCQTVPCFYNKIYGNEESLNGYVHYLWFLKFGYVIAADNKIEKEEGSFRPGIWNGVEKDLKDYLFSDEEMYGFWRTSHLIKDSHETLKSMNEIQRLPRGEALSGGVCGRAWSSGYVNLSDSCLIFKESRNAGYFYYSLIHELSHIVDYEEGRAKNGRYRSHFDDFLDLTKFYKTEYEENGVKKIKWKYYPEAIFISPYSRFSPQEYFAESLSRYRVSPIDYETLNFPKLENLVRDSYYKGLSFKGENQFEDWVKKYHEKKTLAELVRACFSPEAKGESTLFKEMDFVKNFTETQLSCLSDVFLSSQKEMKSEIKMKEIDGCEVLQSKSSEWSNYTQRWFPKFVEKLDEPLREEDKKEERVQDKPPLPNLEDDELSLKAMLNCTYAEEKKICYQQELVKILTGILDQYGLDELEEREFTERYIEFHPYEEVSIRVNQSVEKIIQTLIPEITDHVSHSWESCFTEKEKEEMYLEGRIDLKGGYMKSGMMNCLNRRIPEASKKLINGLKLKTKLSSSDEAVLTRGVSDHLVKEMGDFYSQEASAEAQRAEDWITKNKTNLASKITPKMKKNKTNCQRYALSRITFEANYHTKNDLFYPFVRDQLCKP